MEFALLLPSLRYHFLAGFVNFPIFYNYILWKILRRLSLTVATKTPYIVNKARAYAMHCYKCNLDTCYCCQRDVLYSCKLNFSHNSYYLSAILFSIFLFIICVCNFCIWRKCKMRTISSHQQNRTAQKRPTRDKNIAFRICCCCFGVASDYVIVEYLLNVHKIFPAWQVNYTTIFLQYSNSFDNPIIYAFKIPEFRQSSIMWCLRRRAINGVDTKNKKGRTDTVAFDLSKAKQLGSLTDPSDTQQKFEHEFTDTKLWSEVATLYTALLRSSTHF